MRSLERTDLVDHAHSLGQKGDQRLVNPGELRAVFL